MKKISRLDEKTFDFGIVGMSNRNGILMRFERIEKDDNNSYSGFKFPNAYACITEDGTIKVDPENAEDIFNRDKEANQAILKKHYKISITFFVIAIVSLICMLPTSIFLDEYYGRLCLASSLIFAALARAPFLVREIPKRIIRNKDYMQMCRFHAAEHAVINAYYDLLRVPTMEEVKNYSIFSYTCSVAIMMKKIFHFLVYGICCLIPNLWLCCIGLLIFVLFSLFFDDDKNVYFTAIYTLSKPTEFEYDAAIKVLTAAVEKKQQIEEQLGESVLSFMPKINEIMGNILNGEIPIIRIVIEDSDEDSEEE